jgi:predicted esterase
VLLLPLPLPPPLLLTMPLPPPHLDSRLSFLQHSLQIIGILDTAKASYENIFVGGFSQGGCLSLHMIRSELVTKLPEQLKGIFSMGSFLVSNSVVLQEERMLSDEGNMLLDIPIFMMHGM